MRKFLRVWAFVGTQFIVSLPAIADAPDTLWTKTYGGTSRDQGYSVQETMDGGYIIAGHTYSSSTGDDLWIIKTTSSGDTLWTRTYGSGSMGDRGHCIQQTQDGGFIITGFVGSGGAGWDDVWLLKTDTLGDTLWTKTFGGTDNDKGWSVQQTADGGYIIAGYTESFGAGESDVYLIRTNADGDTLWTRTYGGTDYDWGYSVQECALGGFIIAGETYSFGAGRSDVYLIRTDADGDTLWTKTYGGTDGEWGYSIEECASGGFIIAGLTRSFGAGGDDVYLIRTNTDGDMLWTKTYGGTAYDYGRSVQECASGGFIIAGNTESFGAGSYDVYLIRTDADGDMLWTKTYGGTDYDDGRSVQECALGGFIIAGSTKSFGAGSHDVYLIKVAPEELSILDLVLSPIDDSDLQANTTTDKLDVVVMIHNRELDTLRDVKVKCYVDGDSIPVDMGDYDSNGDGKLDKLPPNTTVRRKVAYKENLPPSWENKEILVKVTEIDGDSVDIQYSKQISIYYAKSEGGAGHPYSLTTDAYSFENFGFNWKSWKEWLSTFGIDPAVFLIELVLGHWKGRCYGMSATSSMYFQDLTNKPYGLTDTPTYEMDSTNTSVMQYINNYYASQRNENLNPADAQVVYDNVKYHITNHRVPVIVLFENEQRIHAIAAYKLIDDLSKNKSYLYVYENAPPYFDDPPYYTCAEFDLTAGTFDYLYFSEVQQFAPHQVTEADVANLLDNVLWEGLSDAWNWVKSVFGLACPARMLLTDSLGRRVGYIDDTTQVNEIPGAEIHMYAWDEGDSVSIYYVPADLKYDVKYFSIGVGEMSAEILIPKTDSSAKYYKYYEIAIDSNTVATLESSPTSDYVLEIDYDGDTNVDTTVAPDTGTMHGIQEREHENKIPLDHFLSQSFPNPFVSGIQIRYGLPKNSYVEITVYNLLGQKVASLVQENKKAGCYTISWDGRNNAGKRVATGIYFYRMETDKFKATRKLTIIR